MSRNGFLDDKYSHWRKSQPDARGYKHAASVSILMNKQQTGAKAVPSSPTLLTLPQEIRNIILDYVIEANEQTRVRFYTAQPNKATQNTAIPWIGAALTNKQLKAELYAEQRANKSQKVTDTKEEIWKFVRRFPRLQDVVKAVGWDEDVTEYDVHVTDATMDQDAQDWVEQQQELWKSYCSLLGAGMASANVIDTWGRSIRYHTMRVEVVFDEKRQRHSFSTQVRSLPATSAAGRSTLVYCSSIPT